MTNSGLHNFLKLKDPSLFNSNTALLCNQISFDFNSGNYLFEILHQRGILKKVFIPEHGLFAEFQDQVKLNYTDIYDFLDLNAAFISLYGSNKNSIYIKKEDLSELDTIIIDIQDIGSRYYTYLSTINNLFSSIKNHSKNLKVYIIDHPNPAGRQVEGTRLTEEFSSFIGITGLPHRHGLTIGEMCTYLRYEMEATFQMEVILFDKEDFHAPLNISPSPNFPSITTAKLYTGQCLFEGTILSEGRGTTKPFEIIGAPFLDWDILLKIQNDLFTSFPFFKNKVALRPIRFIPTDHKFKGEVCNGFQIHILNTDFHSLLFSLVLIQHIEKHTDQPIWKKGKYEFGSDNTAIELLVGDKKILGCLQNAEDFKTIFPFLQKEENSWIETVKKHILYPYELSTQKMY